MAQRILERGQIETLAQRDIPRIVLPARDDVFAARARRLRALAATSAIGGYLDLVAAAADAQQAALAAIAAHELARLQGAAAMQRPPAAAQAGMPSLPADGLARDPAWRSLLQQIVAACREHPAFPPAARAVLARLAEADDAWLEAQADAVLGVPGARAPDVAAAPFVMAALQVLWVILLLGLPAGALAPMADAPGLCPCCGTPPVASLVHATGAQAGYRFLACPLCACQWHCVRVQCTRCHAAGDAIAYHTLATVDAVDETVAKDAAVRAETCTQCHGYRIILYLEKDSTLEAVADDLAAYALGVLLAEQGFERMSGNPLLWQGAER